MVPLPGLALLDGVVAGRCRTDTAEVLDEPACHAEDVIVNNHRRTSL